MKSAKILVFAPLLFSMSLSAGILTAVSSRSGIGGSETLSFVGLGMDQDPITNPTSTTTSAQRVVTMSMAGTVSPMFLFSGSTFNADFLATDIVLSNFASGANSIRFTFGSSIAAVGAQIQPNLFGGFTGVVEAYDAASVSMGLISLAGLNGGNNDGTALFLGVMSSLADIRSIEFRIMGGGDFAVNRLSINPTAIPEPGTVALALSGLTAAAILRWKRRV
jgi:hypothetical protein